MGGGGALGLHADLRGCRVQLGGSCRERPGNIERKEGKSRPLRNVWCSRAHRHARRGIGRRRRGRTLGEGDEGLWINGDDEDKSAAFHTGRSGRAFGEGGPG